MIESYDSLLKNFKTSEDGPGFHGDIHLINFVDTILGKCDSFIETGTNMGNTLFFVSRNYDINCYSCEVHSNTPNFVFDYKNVYFKNIGSPHFIYDLVSNKPELLNNICFFWLDAHFNGGENIIFEEINFIVKNFKNYYIFADDIDINNPIFTNNGYKLSDIQKILNPNDIIYIPNYTDQTSNFHKLTGWCCITNQELNNNTKIKKL
jgi:hypothetical protein